MTGAFWQLRKIEELCATIIAQRPRKLRATASLIAHRKITRNKERRSAETGSGGRFGGNRGSGAAPEGLTAQEISDALKSATPRRTLQYRFKSLVDDK